METPIEKHKRQERELLERKWEEIKDPTPLKLIKLGKLKLGFLNKLRGYDEMTGAELGLILERQSFIKIYKYIKLENGEFQPPEIRWYYMNPFKIEDLPKIIAKDRKNE